MQKLCRLVVACLTGTTLLSCGGGGDGPSAPAPVLTTLSVSLATATIQVGQTSTATAAGLDQFGAFISTGVVSWTTGSSAVATVTESGVVTGIGPGQTQVRASAGGRQAQATITVEAVPVAGCGSPLHLTVGEIHRLSASQVASLCLGGAGSATEYVLIPFNSTRVAASVMEVQITGTNTAEILPGSLASPPPSGSQPGLKMPALGMSSEFDFRLRERRDVASALTSFRQLPRDQRQPRNRQRSTGTSAGLSPSFITGLPAEPVVGATYQINAKLSGNSCSDAKELHAAVVVAVLPHTIVLHDQTSPPNGWTTSEMAAFGQAFENTGYPLGVAAFGAPSDIDGNGRVAILYTPSVNAVPAGGLFATRDLFPVANCPGSNEGEMFYMPVPDVDGTINTSFSSKDDLSRINLSVLVHEFQHLINAGRRVYVNDASSFEEVWLNEGLSHIAEELLYYQRSGSAPQSNIDLDRLRSEGVAFVNAGQVGNLGRVSQYMESPETSSPFAQNNSGETRGAIWQLLRYSGDMKGGSQQDTWFSLVNSTLAGQANFGAVFGDIITLTRDWTVAQFTDDAGLGVTANYTHPSWNYRSILPVINDDVFPLATRALIGAPQTIALGGGGAAYLRFRVAAGVPATITATSQGQAVPAAVEFTLVRTQ